MIETLAPHLDVLKLILLLLIMAALVFSSIRLVIGPGVADRFIALDMLTVLAVALCALTAAVTGRREFLDVALGLAVTGFVATVALAVFLERKRVKS